MSPSLPQVMTGTSESREESGQHAMLNVELTLALEYISTDALEVSARRDRTENPTNLCWWR